MRRICILLAFMQCAALADTAKTTHPEMALQIGHTGEVERVALSPDGATVASAELGAGTIKIWDARSGEILHTIREPGNSLIWGLKFSPNGLLLAVALSEGIKLWNTRTGTLERFLPGNHVFGLFISNDAEFAFSADGHWLAQIADIDNKGRVLQLWNLRSGEVVWRTDLAPGNSYSVMFAPDGKRLIGLQLEDNLILNWDGATGAPVAPLPLDAKIAGPPVFSADGSLVAFIKEQNEMFEIAVCDVQTGKLLRTLKEDWDGFSSFALSPDGNLLAVATSKGTLNLWNPRNGEQLHKLSLPEPEKLISAAISSDGKTLVAGAGNGSVLLYGVTIPTLPHLTRTLQGLNDSLSGVAYSPDGSKIFSEVVPLGQSLPQLYEWDMKAGILSRTQKESTFTLGGRVALSPDGAIRASATINPQGGAVQLLDAKTGAVLRILNDSQNVNSLTFINGGKTIAVGTIDKGLCLWDVATGMLKQSIRPKPLEPETGKVVVSSPNGQLLASAETMGNIQLWNAQQEPFLEPLRTIELKGEASVLTTMAFSPDSSTLALARLSDILLIDVKTGQIVRSLAEHGGYVFGITFAADGQRLVTGGDGTVKIWNAQTGRLLVTFYNLPSNTKTDAQDFLVVTPEGYYAGSATADRYVRFRLGDTLFPAESFQARYFRPDLVKKALSGEELPPVGAFHGAFPPLAAFISPPPDSKITGNSVTLSVATTDDSVVQNLVYFINGARVEAKPLTAESRPLELGAKALELGAKALELGAKALEIGAKAIELGAKPLEATPGARQSIPAAHKTLNRLTVTLPLPVGENNIKVQVIAFDDDSLQSPRDELHLTRDLLVAATAGKLLGLCVGVSRYQTTPLNLRYADADAQALTSDFNRQTTLYNPPQIMALTNEEATAGAITSALDKLIDTTTKADTVLISLSGHGWRDEQNRFYFATHEVDRKNVAQSALPWSVIMERLTKLSQKSKRVIVLLDACHSGSAATNEELVKATLSANAGVMIFASSRGDEVSLEDAAWGHGAFTKALLEAVQGLAAAPEEKQVTTLDFIAYVSRRVKQLTGNQQHPQVPFLQDFDTDAPLVQKP